MDFKEQLKSHVDLAGVAAEYGVRLIKAGPSRFKGLCPFHTEKTPSFHINTDRQFFHCFGCSAGGDVFHFVMRIEGVSFYEALKLLAERHGIPLPRRSLVADENTRLRETVFDMHKAALEHFRASLTGASGETARGYLARRGLAPATVDEFELGYSGRSGRDLLRVFEPRGYTAAQLEQSGLFAKRADGSFYDRFRDRLMFPIHDESGRVIGFGGRALAAGDEPKYLNSPETPIYKKSRVLYNLHRAKKAIGKEDRTILVEGYMDAIGVSAAGFGAVVASCGTALTSQQVLMLRRHSPKIVVNFDPDTAGANASERSINLLLSENMLVSIMELDGDLDPDEYCKERGREAYRQRLEQSKGYFYWLADRARARNDMHSTDGRIAVLKQVLAAVQLIPDKLERLAIADDVASYVGVERGAILDSFRKAAAERQEQPLQRVRVALRADERLLLHALIEDAGLQDEAMAELKGLETISAFATCRIFQAAFALHASGGRVTFDALHERLEESDRNLLAEAVLADETEISRDAAMAAIRSMRLSEARLLRDRLKSRIKELERAGEWQEALRLAGELQGLEKGARDSR